MGARDDLHGGHRTRWTYLTRRRRRRAWLHETFAGAMGLGLCLMAHRSRAGGRLNHKRILPYPRRQAWPAALRYLRVDRNYMIVDRDPDLGYALFEIPLSGERTARASFEMIETQDDAGRPSVSLEINTEAGPSHLPHALAEGIARKLREERGPPAPPPPPPDAETPRDPPDEGDDPPFLLSPNGPGES